MKKMNGGGKKKSMKKLAKSARNFKSQKASWRKLSLVLCDDLKGWNGRMGRKLNREGIYVYTWLIHNVVQQNLTHCKIIIFQLKKKKSWSYKYTTINPKFKTQAISSKI